MLSAEDNELLTRTGAGTPMGELFRRFWQPVLLSQELPEPDGPPVRVKILGEDLLAFRDTDGRVGLLDPVCPAPRRQPLLRPQHLGPTDLAIIEFRTLILRAARDLRAGVEPPAARNAAGYRVRGGSIVADRGLSFAETMTKRFGDALGRVKR